MREKFVIGFIISLISIAIVATSAFAECPEGKQPVNITTPSGKTKTLCIPAAAVQGIETAAEHSGGTIVASNCPCFTADDIIALDAIGELVCAGRGENDSNGNLIFEAFSCKNFYGRVSVTYDISAVNRCYYSFPGDKYTPAVTIDEVISASEYDTCKSTLISVVSPK